MPCIASYARFIFGKFHTSTIILYALLFAQKLYSCKKWVLQQTLNNMQPNQQAHLQQAPPPPPQHQSDLAEFLQTRPTTFSQAKDPMEAEDWFKEVEKKLVIAQCTDHERVLFAAHQLFGTAANWWETYCSTHADFDSITWNEFKAHHYVPRGTMKLKKEFTNLR
jgi:hypothetical protein